MGTEGTDLVGAGTVGTVGTGDGGDDGVNGDVGGEIAVGKTASVESAATTTESI